MLPLLCCQANSNVQSSLFHTCHRSPTRANSRQHNSLCSINNSGIIGYLHLGSHVCKGFLDAAHITRPVIDNDYHLLILRSVIYCPFQLPEPAQASKEQVVGVSHPAGSSLTTGNTSLLTIPPQTNLPKGHSLYPVFPVFQEDLAKMCISMSNNSRHFSRWIEHDSRSFNQSAKGRSLPFSGYNCSIHIIDRPTILK